MLLLLFVSCIKNSEVISPSDLYPMGLRIDMQESMCVDSLRAYLEKEKCDGVHYKILSPSDIRIRCKRKEGFSINKWNSSTFKIIKSDASIKDRNLKEQRDRTICEDKNWRIEIIN